MFVFMGSWKFWQISVYKLLLGISLSFSVALCAQESQPSVMAQDTVYVLFERSGNKIQETRTSVYSKPELAYPQDITREFIIVSRQLGCTDCQSNAWPEIVLTYYPDAKSHDYKLMPKKEFLKLDYKDQDWFNETPVDDIYALLKDKVIYLVDEGYLSDGKVFLLQVSHYDFIEE